MMRIIPSQSRRTDNHQQNEHHRSAMSLVEMATVIVTTATLVTIAVQAITLFMSAELRATAELTESTTLDRFESILKQDVHAAESAELTDEDGSSILKLNGIQTQREMETVNYEFTKKTITRTRWTNGEQVGSDRFQLQSGHYECEIDDAILTLNFRQLPVPISDNRSTDFMTSHAPRLRSTVMMIGWNSSVDSTQSDADQIDPKSTGSEEAP